MARLFATLDHMTGGRAAWNIVTSVNDAEARNMGFDHGLEHDARYDQADEFLEVVHGHWDTWDPDALVLDRPEGLFARGDKVHRLDHRGEHYNSRGPFTVPRTPQGHPVMIQAGQSGRGQRFAARWGEVMFASNLRLQLGQGPVRPVEGGGGQPRPQPRSPEAGHPDLPRGGPDQGRGRGPAGRLRLAVT